MKSNGNTPITRADLEEFGLELVRQIGGFIDARVQQSEEKFAEHLLKLDEKVTERLVKLDEKFAERLHDAETRLLRAFYQYQEHADVRMRKMSGDISNMDTASELRLNNLERRVIEVERKFLESGL